MADEAFRQQVKNRRDYLRSSRGKILVWTAAEREEDVMRLLSEKTPDLAAIRLRMPDLALFRAGGFTVLPVSDRNGLEALARFLQGERGRAEIESDSGENLSASADSGRIVTAFVFHEPRTESVSVTGTGTRIETGSEAGADYAHLIGDIPKQYEPAELYVYRERFCFPFYFRAAEPAEKLDARTAVRGKPKPKAVIADWFLGYGDGVILLPLLRKFIDREARLGHEVHLIAKEKLASFLGTFLQGCRIYRSPESPAVYEAVLRSSLYRKAILLPVSVSSPPMRHISGLFGAALGFKRPYPLPEPAPAVYPPLPAEQAEELAVLRAAGCKVVGIQFHTGDAKRSWPEARAREFIALCREWGLALVNLTPLPYPAEGCSDWSMLPVKELFAAIEGLDAVVGIDSVCGHVAGFLGVPHITLWGRSFPHLQFPFTSDESHVSFRTLRANYSLVPQSADIADIPAELAFARLTDILEGRLSPGKELHTAEDTLKGQGIEWVSGR
ncbi:glycosyltransferase family 9 protein [Paenibacillus chitinolyticus]|uniref:glycosyltransferase family 9 protein n=1 Tax=Paenibacillus chitinolyticus TaxID=79263 RepID=UPI00355910D6